MSAMQGNDSNGNGVQIVSDGTAEGTRVLLDGKPVRGVTEVEWKVNVRERKAVLVLALREVRLDANAEVSEELREQLARLTEEL